MREDAVKVTSLKKSKARFNDAVKTVNSKSSQDITAGGTSIASFKPKRWQDYIGICEGIITAHLQGKKKESQD